MWRLAAAAAATAACSGGATGVRRVGVALPRSFPRSIQPANLSIVTTTAISRGTDTSINQQHRINGGSIRRYRVSSSRTSTSTSTSTATAAATAIAAGSAFTVWWLFSNDAHTSVAEPARPLPLPEYTRAQVSKHKSRTDGNGVWVTYKGGVYDITEFIDKHPGGSEKIMMAAGGAIDPFWAMYQQHNHDNVRAMLEPFRIGSLSAADQQTDRDHADANDPYGHDPPRHPVLRVSNPKPFNAEPPASLLADNFITPNELFFKRNHLPVPVVDPKTYALEIDGLGVKNGSVKLSLNDLKTKFKTHTVTATLMMNTARPVKGLDWSVGAISNATWTGVKLRDVLLYAGVDVQSLELDPNSTSLDNPNAPHHVEFEGLDKDMANTTYGASIPIDTAIDSRADVLLAFEMNGQELPRDHGYPVRVVVPGIVGARNVKWLGKITVSKDESRSHWQQNDYKGFCPSVTDVPDYKTAPAIQETPVTSAICSPSAGAIVSADDEELTIKGYAWSGGGRDIIRVDLSIDGGNTWFTAPLIKKVGDEKNDEAPPPSSKPPPFKYSGVWAWSLFNTTVPIPKHVLEKAKKEPDGAKLQLICKAVDSSYNVQPDTIPPIWNVRGVLNDSWHRVEVTVKNQL